MYLRNQRFTLYSHFKTCLKIFSEIVGLLGIGFNYAYLGGLKSKPFPPVFPLAIECFATQFLLDNLIIMLLKI